VPACRTGTHETNSFMYVPYTYSATCAGFLSRNRLSCCHQLPSFCQIYKTYVYP